MYMYMYANLRIRFQEYLRGIAKDPKKSIFCKQRSLCHSIAGNEVPLLTITSPSGSLNEAQVHMYMYDYIINVLNLYKYMHA